MQLWQPRRPAVSRKLRIFGWRPFPAHSTRWFWGCVMPSLTCVLLTLLTIVRTEDSFGQKTARRAPLTKMGLARLASEQGLTAQNRWDAVTFEWTNRSVIKTIIPFAPSTNFIN